MVLYFEARGGYMLYMGRDKHENEHLIKHGWPEDVWFHVDDLSSAHVYLRLPVGPVRRKFRETGNLDHIPEAMEDCCALVKANSIEGSKRTTVSVVYTEWENLKKTGNMVDGQVGFTDSKKVVKVREVPKVNEIVNRLNRTKKEEFPDLALQRQQRDRKLQQLRKEKAKVQAKADEALKQQRIKEKDARDYKHMFEGGEMQTNVDVAASADTSAAVNFEDDFF